MEMPFGLEPWLFWLLLAIALFIAEIFTPGFLVACLGIGALLAVVPAAFDLGLAWQLPVFSLGCLLSLWLLRPMFNKPKGQGYVSGVDALVGRTIRLSADIPEGGYVEVPIDGDVWRVSMRDGSAASKGALIRIVSYEGIILQAKEVSEV